MIEGSSPISFLARLRFVCMFLSAAFLLAYFPAFRKLEDIDIGSMILWFPFSSYVERARNAPIIVTKNGRPAAILVSGPEDEEDLERFFIAHNPKFQRLIESAYKKIQKSGEIRPGNFWKNI